MDRLKNIEISPTEIHNIIKHSFFSNGGEAVVCRTNNPNTLYKIFYKGQMYNVVPMSENKLRKLEILHSLQLTGSVFPLRTITCNKELIGYEMTYNPEEIRFFPGEFDRSDVISKLESIKDILEYFARYDITYADVASRNILFNKHTGKMKFCDMDNVQIGQYPIDIIPLKLSPYYDVCGIDEKTDAYMHNLLTLDILNSRKQKLEKEFSRKALPIIESMKEPENFQGEYIIQYVKKRR